MRSEIKKKKDHRDHDRAAFLIGDDDSKDDEVAPTYVDRGGRMSAR